MGFRAHGFRTFKDSLGSAHRPLSIQGLMLSRFRASGLGFELRTKFSLGGPIEDYIGFWGDLLRDILQI